MIDLIEGTDVPPLRSTDVGKLPIGDMVIPPRPLCGCAVGTRKETQRVFSILPVHCAYSCGHPYLLVGNGVN